MSNLSCSRAARIVPVCCLALGAALGLAGCAHESPAAKQTAPGPAPAAAPEPVKETNAVVPPPPANTQAEDALRAAAAADSKPFEGEGWRDLLDGQSLAGWRETRFSGQGEVECKHGLVLMHMGNPFTGVSVTNELPKINYEVAFDAMRVMGSDFFCGLTVPVGDSFCSLIVGGWGGGLVGISSLDSLDASENQTTKYMKFDQGRWYRIRLRVTDKKLEGWIDDDKVVNVATEGKRVHLRFGEIELSKPFGICCWQTSAAFRNMKLRTVTGPASPP